MFGPNHVSTGGSELLQVSAKSGCEFLSLLFVFEKWTTAATVCLLETSSPVQSESFRFAEFDLRENVSVSMSVSSFLRAW